MSKPSFLIRLLVRLGFPVRVGSVTEPSWKGSLPLYAFRCPIHGVVENRPQGYGERLECPECARVAAEGTR